MHFLQSANHGWLSPSVIGPTLITANLYVGAQERVMHEVEPMVISGSGRSLDRPVRDPMRQVVLAKLVQVLVDVAGARRGFYLSVGDRFAVEAAVAVPGAGHAAEQPESILQHVRRTHEKVLLCDATLPNAFSGDEQIARRRPRSVVCLPVLQHGDLIGLVYLENELVPRALTPDQVTVLELLATQAGQFLESASVHADLERKDREQREGAAALRTIREQLQAILDNMVDGVFVCDATGKLTLVNDTVLGLLTLPQEQILRPVDELAALLSARHPDGRAFAPDELPLVRALRGEILSSIDMTVTDPRTGRDTHLRVNAAPLQNEKGAIVGAVAAASNVTEMVELDRQKNEFLRMAAHELKTPVTIIKGYAETFRRTAKDVPPAQRRMLEALVRGADRIDRIVSDLLLLQQIRSGRLELVLEDGVDLVQVAESAACRLEPDPASRRIEVAAARPVIVRGDRQLLGQVLSNLMSNALRYSPSGSAAEVVLDTDGEREAVVLVTDHGVGIPKEKQSRIFEPFYRAHTDTPYDFGGMGGGLCLAKAIITRHGGTIGFVSEEGRGSTFTIRLPLGRADRLTPAPDTW